jgi:hypothetical protein
MISIILDIHLEAQSELVQIVQTLRLLRLSLRFGQGGQKHCGQNGDDRDHDQKFYQRKSRAIAPWKPFKS